MHSPILSVLGISFSISVLGYAAGMLPEDGRGSASPAAISKDPTFSELDAWSAELSAEADAIRAEKNAATLALAEAERMANQAAAVRTKNQFTADRARRLATVYGAMDAVIAAETLSALSVEKAAAVVAEMAPDVAGPILQAMPTPHAQNIADHLLGG